MTTDEFAYSGSGQKARNTWASTFPMIIWASKNPMPTGQDYNGWRIEAGKYDDLDRELHDLGGWPTVTILHGQRRVEHYDLRESGEFFIVATDYLTGRANDTPSSETRKGIARGYNPGKDDNGKVIGSKIEAVAFYRPWADMGVYVPLLLTASRMFTSNRTQEPGSKNWEYSGLSIALGDHYKALTVQDELRKATAEKRGVDAPGPSPFYSLAMSAVPGKLVPMGQGENAAWGMSIVSGHPAEPDRDYIFARSLLNKQYVELKALIQQMMPFALPWSVDRSKELDG